jgi:ketosteroid isomerase-like protein
MKKLLCIVVSFLLLAGSSTAQQAKVKKEPDKLKTKTESREGKESKVKVEDDKMIIKNEGVGKGLVYPYTAEYSSQFVPGSPEHARLALDVWKAWEANDLDRQAAAFADTIMIDFSQGQTVRGKDSVLAVLKRGRSDFTTSVPVMEAWMPFKSLDRNESWVAVWVRVQDTDKAGKQSVTRYHDMWRINRDGKIDYLRQYAAPLPPQ